MADPTGIEREQLEEPVVLVEVVAGVAWIRLNRPRRMNAITTGMRAELAEALKRVERDGAVRCVVLTGQGRAFCSGQDVKEFEERVTAELRGAAASEKAGRTLREEYLPIITRLRTMPKPVIAAVNGVAAGVGASFAMACDIRIGTPAAAFVEAFVGIGLVPDGGATWMLPRLVGTGRALEMLFTGRPVGATDAERFGLLNQIVAEEQLDAVVGALAATLATGPAEAIAATKRAVNHAAGCDLEEAMEFESYLQEVMAAGDDFREGVAAFGAKRAPRFKGAPGD
ncbi:MAG: enoyl-CoA hydratase/isomerase family protein [Candidatus Dormibacteraceae bacterium]